MKHWKVTGRVFGYTIRLSKNHRDLGCLITDLREDITIKLQSDNELSLKYNFCTCNFSRSETKLRKM